MFTLRKKPAVSIKLFQGGDNGVMGIRGLEVLSKSISRLEIKEGTVESIIARVLKTVFGVGQKSLENIVHETAKRIAESLDEQELGIFREISRPDGSLFWNGEQDEVMKRIFLSRKQNLHSIVSFDALYKK